MLPILPYLHPSPPSTRYHWCVHQSPFLSFMILRHELTLYRSLIKTWPGGAMQPSRKARSFRHLSELWGDLSSRPPSLKRYPPDCSLNDSVATIYQSLNRTNSQPIVYLSPPLIDCCMRLPLILMSISDLDAVERSDVRCSQHVPSAEHSTHLKARLGFGEA